MRIPHPSLTSPHGFTLLEMLTAVTITVIIVLLLTTAFNSASQGWLRSENMTETAMAARIGLDYMARDIAAAVISPSYNFYGTSAHLAFAKADSIAYYAVPADISYGRTDIYEKMYIREGSRPYAITLRTSQSALGGRLQPTWDMQTYAVITRADSWPSSYRESSMLLTNVTFVRFTYYTNSPAAPTPFFTNYWNSASNSVPNCFGTGATLPNPQPYMINRLPWGVLVELEIIDDRAARRLLPGMSATASNQVIRQAARTYSMFVQIPASRQ